MKDRESIVGKILLKLIAVLIVVYIIFSYLGTKLSGLDEHSSRLMDKNITTEVVRKDGTVQYSESAQFSVLNKGDQLTAWISLPVEDKIDNGVLCFYVYHSIIHVYSGDTLLYTYGQELADEGRQIGSEYPIIEIPDDAWGSELKLVCDVQENSAFSGLKDVTVMKLVDSDKYFILNHLLDLCLFMALFVVSAAGLLICIMAKELHGMRRKGFAISLFNIDMSIYILSHFGIIHYVVSSERLASELEYLSLFSLPALLVWYLYEEHIDPRCKNELLRMTWIFTGFFVITTALNYLTVNYHYCSFVKLLHFLMIVGMLHIIVLFYRVTGFQSRQTRIMKYALLVLMAFFLTDIISFNVQKYSPVEFRVEVYSFIPLGVMIFVLILVNGYVVQLLNRYVEDSERKRLEQLAFHDRLTGISNRTMCDNILKELKNREESEFIILFFDINNLKFANDTYGHNMGDLLIMKVAQALQEVFEPAGFCGRYGGDEFIAVLEGKNCRYLQLLMVQFDDLIEKINIGEELPFKVQVACGMGRGERNSVEVEQVLKTADENMYRNKKKLKLM